MKIFAIMLVKDEADIVASVLKAAEKWADKIFVLDNGSTYGTWEIIKSLQNNIITPWKQDFRSFSRGMRSEVFNHFKHLSEPGDWWCLALDADEFYIDSPREFLANIPSRIKLVSKKSIDYYITQQDIENNLIGKNSEENLSKIKYFKSPCWTEPRFFKFQNNIKWPVTIESQYPLKLGKPYKRYILVKHYQFRSPAQMQKRLDVRNNTEAKKKGLAFRHIKETDWHELLKNTNDLIFDNESYENYRNLPIVVKMKTKLVTKLFTKLNNYWFKR